MLYREFVKENFHKLPADLSAKEKIKEIAKLWKEQKGNTNDNDNTPVKSTKHIAHLKGRLHKDNVPKELVSGGPRSRGRPKKDTKYHGVVSGGPRSSPHKGKGAGLFGDIGNAVDGIGSIFGLGLDKKKKSLSRPRLSKGPEGAGLFGDIGNAVDGIGSIFGLGLDKKKKSLGRPRLSKGAEGAGLFGDIGKGIDGIGSIFGLGLEKKKSRGRPRKATAGGSMGGMNNTIYAPHGFTGEGGNFLTDFISNIFGGELDQNKRKKLTKKVLSNSKLMKLIAEHRAKGGGLGNIFRHIAPILDLII